MVICFHVHVSSIMVVRLALCVCVCRAQRILQQLAAVSLLKLVITVYDIVVKVDCFETSNVLHDHDASA